MIIDEIRNEIIWPSITKKFFKYQEKSPEIHNTIINLTKTEYIYSMILNLAKRFKKYNLNSKEDIAALSDYAIAANEKIRISEANIFQERVEKINHKY